MHGICRRERDKWLLESTKVTDDPRRVPVGEAEAFARLLVLEGGRVFDSTGRDVREASILIRGNVIEEVLPAGSNIWPKDACVLDLKGMTVMPGLIDAHTHLTYTEPGLPIEVAQSEADCTMRALERLRYFLETGVTSVRDAGSHGDVPFRIKEWVRQNRLPLPRVFAAGCLITGTGGHAAEKLSAVSSHYGKIREASGADDWRNAVRQEFKKGADVIKVASHFSREEIAAAVDEAHTLGLKVMCDAETFYIDWAVDAGVDCIEHPLPRTDEAICKMAEKRVQSVPTLIPYAIIIGQYGGYFGSTSRRFTFSCEANLDVVRRMKKAGVKIGVGTDIVMDWFRYLPEAYIEELRMYKSAGFSTHEALMAATLVNAEILDMDRLLGSLEPGKLADVLIVDGRPDECLDDLKNVHTVIRDGHIVLEQGRLRQERHEGWSLSKKSAAKW